MNRETLNVERIKYNKYGKEYYIYLSSNESEKGFTDFHIQKKDCGIISYTIGIDLKKLGCSAEEFIDENLDEWISDYEYDIAKIEDESCNPNMEI